MRRQPLPAPWNRGPLTALYLVLLAVIVAALRLIGRGWIGAITAGLVLAGVLTTPLVLAGSYRAEHLGKRGNDDHKGARWKKGDDSRAVPHTPYTSAPSAQTAHSAPRQGNDGHTAARCKRGENDSSHAGGRDNQ